MFFDRFRIRAVEVLTVEDQVPRFARNVLSVDSTRKEFKMTIKFKPFALVIAVGFSLLGSSACTPGPQGPPGPAGPAGASGPPYVWGCTPAHLPNSSGSPRSDLYVFNGSTATANVAVNILDRDGNNLTGITIPGSNPARTYPGESGSATSPVLPTHTRDLDWVMPQAGGGPGFDGITNVAVTVRVTSDQPIIVGANFQFNGNVPSLCSPLPK